MTNKTSLKNQYAILVAAYIGLFEAKHGYAFSGWIGDFGEMATFCGEEYYFTFNDIRFDIDNKINKGLIFRWHDEGVEHNLPRKEPRWINFKNYCKGLRYKDL